MDHWTLWMRKAKERIKGASVRFIISSCSKVVSCVGTFAAIIGDNHNLCGTTECAGPPKPNEIKEINKSVDWLIQSQRRRLQSQTVQLKQPVTRIISAMDSLLTCKHEENKTGKYKTSIPDGDN